MKKGISVLAFLAVLLLFKISYIQAYFNFMAPGVPASAMCKMVAQPPAIEAYFDPASLTLGIGQEGVVVFRLRNNSQSDATLLRAEFILSFDSQLVRIDRLEIPASLGCVVVKEQTFVRNADGLVSIVLDKDAKEGCSPPVLKANSSITLGTFRIVPLANGIATLNLDTPSSGKILIAETRDNVFSRLVPLIINIGNGQSPLPQNTPLPTQTQPVPTQVPATGVLDSPLILVVAGIALISLGMWYEYKVNPS